MKKKILYIDMDGVVADFDKALENYDSNINNRNHLTDQIQATIRNNKVDEICEANDDFFITCLW